MSLQIEDVIPCDPSPPLEIWHLIIIWEVKITTTVLVLPKLITC